MSRILFVTGTDTGAGKTVLTGLLLAHLRASGVNALAIKPFCSGNRADAQRLNRLQDQALALAEVNPWFAKRPVTPAVGLGQNAKKVNKDGVVAHIRRIARRCDLLLVEGAGGLLSPLGEGVDALAIVRELGCPVVVAARNRLGCLNHAFLTAHALASAGIRQKKVVLMGVPRPDLSAKTNGWEMQKKGVFIEVYAISHLGRGAAGRAAVKKNAKILKKTLAHILAFGIFRPLFAKRRQNAAEKKLKKL